MYGARPTWMRKQPRWKRFGRPERVPVAKARALYDMCGCWRDVARLLKRKDGTPFQAMSIRNAVRRADRGMTT